MKTILKFRKRKLSNVFLIFREKDELQDALDGSKWKDLVWELDQMLRSESKHGGVEKAYNYRDKLREMMNDRNLTLE